MIDRRHVKSQLVRTSGERMQHQSRTVSESLYHSPFGEGGLAVDGVDAVSRWMIEVLTQWEIDRAAIVDRFATDDGRVLLVDESFGKLPAQFSLGIGIASE